MQCDELAIYLVRKCRDIVGLIDSFCLVLDCGGPRECNFISHMISRIKILNLGCQLDISEKPANCESWYTDREGLLGAIAKHTPPDTPNDEWGDLRIMFRVMQNYPDVFDLVIQAIDSRPDPISSDVVDGGQHVG